MPVIEDDGVMDNNECMDMNLWQLGWAGRRLK
jgi:hypothetical protein